MSHNTVKIHSFEGQRDSFAAKAPASTLAVKEKEKGMSPKQKQEALTVLSHCEALLKMTKDTAHLLYLAAAQKTQSTVKEDTEKAKDAQKSQYRNGVFIADSFSKGNFVKEFAEMQEEILVSDGSAAVYQSKTLNEEGSYVEKLNIGLNTILDLRNKLTKRVEEIMSQASKLEAPFKGKAWAAASWTLMAIGGVLIIASIVATFLTGGIAAPGVGLAITLFGAVSGMASGVMESVQGGATLEAGALENTAAPLQKYAGETQETQTLVNSSVSYFTTNMSRDANQFKQSARQTMLGYQLLGSLFEGLKAFTAAM